MKNNGFGFFAMIIVALVTVSCGKMPQENIDAAKAAIEKAKNAQADVYMAPEYKSLEDSLGVVMQGVEAENSKMMKSFDGWKVRLDAITARANQVAAEVPARKEAVKTEAQAMVVTVKEELEVATSLLAKAPKGKEGRAALAQIKSELDVIGTNVNAIEAALAGDTNYAEALDKLTAAQKSVTDIKTELTEAIAKTKRR